MSPEGIMEIVILVFLFPVFSSGNEDTYSYDDLDQESVLDYEHEGNDTEEYDSFAGRDGQFLHEQTRPVYPLNHYLSDKNHLHELSTLLNYHHQHRQKPALFKRKRGVKRQHFKHLLPLLLTVLAKVAHFLPVVKLTLLALFALVLFSKKALLVSLGSLILVLYDTFYKGKHQHHNTNNVGLTVVKDRGSTPTVEHGIHTDDHKIETAEESWYGREEVNPPKINPREGISNSDKWKRWWAPQINLKRKPVSSRGMRDELYENLEDIIYNF